MEILRFFFSFSHLYWKMCFLSLFFGTLHWTPWTKNLPHRMLCAYSKIFSNGAKSYRKVTNVKKKEEPTWTNYINRSVCTYIFIGRKCLRQFGVEWMWKQFLSFSFILCSTRNLSNQIKCIENANSAPLPRDAHHSHAVAWRLLYCQRSMNFIRHKLSHWCVQVQIPESFQWNSTR